jgi:hypothetical protein
VNPWDKLNLALAMVAVALAALVLRPGSGPDDMVSLLPDDAGQPATAVRIERDARLVLALRRQADGWRLRYPDHAPADPVRVDRLLAVGRAPVWQTVQTPADAGGSGAARFGLDKPRAVLQIDDVRLLFGDPTPDREGRYVGVGGEIRVVDDLWYRLLALPVRHYRATAANLEPAE